MASRALASALPQQTTRESLERLGVSKNALDRSYGRTGQPWQIAPQAGPIPEVSPWPFTELPTWLEFQEQYEAIKAPARLAVIYELVLALAIFDRLKQQR